MTKATRISPRGFLCERERRIVRVVSSLVHNLSFADAHLVEPERNWLRVSTEFLTCPTFIHIYYMYFFFLCVFLTIVLLLFSVIYTTKDQRMARRVDARNRINEKRDPERIVVSPYLYFTLTSCALYYIYIIDAYHFINFLTAIALFLLLVYLVACLAAIAKQRIPTHPLIDPVGKGFFLPSFPWFICSFINDSGSLIDVPAFFNLSLLAYRKCFPFNPSQLHPAPPKTCQTRPIIYSIRKIDGRRESFRSPFL